MSVRIAVIGLTIIIGCLALAMISSGKEWIVDDDGGSWADYSTIQKAINGSSNNDTILVYSGKYRENIMISTSILLQGNGSNNTIIKGNDDGHVVIVNAHHSQISDFQIFGGGTDQAIIHIQNQTDIKIERLKIYKDSHGIYLENCTNTNIHNTSFNDTVYAIRLIQTKGSEITHNYFNKCQPSINLEESSNNNRISENTFCKGSHAINVEDSNQQKIEFNTITDNLIGIRFDSSLDNHVNNNSVENGYIGMFVYRVTDNNVFENNTIRNFSTCGIHIRNAHNNIFQYCRLLENEIGIEVIESSELNKVKYCDIYSNRAYGIDASDNNGQSIRATYNWWGDSTGPYHPSSNPHGMGDYVSDNVVFSGWILFKTNTPPQVEINVQNGLKIHGIFNITGTASDVDSDILIVEISFDGNTWQLVHGTNEWYYMWNTMIYQDKTYEIRVRSSDGYDYSDESTITVVVDNIKDSGEDGDGIPGFNANIILGALTIFVGLKILYRKRKSPNR